jgi:hypothetical protein
MYVRLTPDVIKEAYKQTGLKPKQQTTLQLCSNNACGLAAYSRWKTPALTRGLDIMCHYWDWYHAGFMDGFDGEEKRRTASSYEEDYCLGYQDGIDCWNSVKEL